MSCDKHTGTHRGSTRTLFRTRSYCCVSSDATAPIVIANSDAPRCS